MTPNPWTRFREFCERESRPEGAFFLIAYVAIALGLIAALAITAHYFARLVWP